MNGGGEGSASGAGGKKRQKTGFPLGRWITPETCPRLKRTLIRRIRPNARNAINVQHGILFGIIAFRCTARMTHETPECLSATLGEIRRAGFGAADVKSL